MENRQAMNADGNWNNLTWIERIFKGDCSNDVGFIKAVQDKKNHVAEHNLTDFQQQTSNMYSDKTDSYPQVATFTTPDGSNFAPKYTPTPAVPYTPTFIGNPATYTCDFKSTLCFNEAALMTGNLPVASTGMSCTAAGKAAAAQKGKNSGMLLWAVLLIGAGGGAYWWYKNKKTA